MQSTDGGTHQPGLRIALIYCNLLFETERKLQTASRMLQKVSASTKTIALVYLNAAKIKLPISFYYQTNNRTDLEFKEQALHLKTIHLPFKKLGIGPSIPVYINSIINFSKTLFYGITT